MPQSLRWRARAAGPHGARPCPRGLAITWARAPRTAARGVLLALAVGSGLVHAANGAKPRTPPTFRDAPCLTLVDRSVDPVVELRIGLPREDVGLTADELPDSRTMQLIALCREPSPLERLPTWVTADDAARALAAGLITQLPPDDDVLELAPAWRDCAVPIQTAAERTALSCDASAGTLRWDTTGVAAGTWNVFAHTFEPAQNLWTRRLGAVRIADDAGGADLAPALAIETPSYESTVYVGATYDVRVCGAASGGGRVRVEWIAAGGDFADPAAWTTVAEVPLRDTSLDGPEAAALPVPVAFTPPMEASNRALFVRAVATDGEGRTRVAHAMAPLLVLVGGCGADPAVVREALDVCDPREPPAEEESGGATPGPCTDSDGDSASTGDASTGGDTGTDATSDPGGDATSAAGSTAGAADDPRGGCGCRAAQAGPAAPGWALVLLLLAWRRRGRRFSAAA